MAHKGSIQLIIAWNIAIIAFVLRPEQDYIVMLYFFVSNNPIQIMREGNGNN